MTENSMQEFKTNAVATTTDADFDALSSGSSLPRFSLYTSNSKEVKEGDFPANTYGLKIGELLHDMGKNSDIVICAYRLTALQVTDDGFCCSHDAKSPLFKDIMNIADTQGFGSGAIYGQEFLVWIPEHKSFATLMCGSKTARNMAAGIKALVGEVATMSSKKLENKKYSWFAMVCTASNAVITSTPSEEDYTAHLTAFAEDIGVERELADTSDAGDDR